MALGHTDTARMDTIEEAVKNPYFQPFMGRRSLPLTADFFLDSSEERLDTLAAVPGRDTGVAGTGFRTTADLCRCPFVA